MANQESSGTRKTAAKRPAKKRAARKSAPAVAAEPVPTPAPTAEPVTAHRGDRLSEVARTIGSTMGAIAATAKRALTHAARKK